MDEVKELLNELNRKVDAQAAALASLEEMSVCCDSLHHWSTP